MRLAPVLLLVGACSLPPAAPAPATPAPVPGAALYGIPGEAMIYEVRLRGVRVARIEVAAGKLGWIDGHRALIVRSRGRTDGMLALVTDITYELTTTLDLDAGHPLRDSERAQVIFEGKQDRTHQERQWSARDIARGVHDLHSAAAALRGWRDAGHATRLEVAIDDTTFGVALAETRRELVRHMPAIRYDGLARERFPFTVWISDDAARVPLGVHATTKWGDIDAVLVEYDPPRDDG